MVRKNDGCGKRVFNRGAWTAEEDTKLAEYIEVHGAKKWKTVATKSGTHTDNIVHCYGESCICQS